VAGATSASKNEAEVGSALDRMMPRPGGSSWRDIVSEEERKKEIGKVFDSYFQKR
jgi:hypothetical protein